MWVRAKDLADMLGCCKKTAKSWAERMGLQIESRPVRGGWAHYVFIPEETTISMMQHADQSRFRRAVGSPNAARLERCMELVDAMAQNITKKGRAKLIATLYEVLP